MLINIYFLYSKNVNISSCLVMILMLLKGYKMFFLQYSTNFIFTKNIMLFECFLKYSKNVKISSFLNVTKTLFKGYKNMSYDVICT